MKNSFKNNTILMNMLLLSNTGDGPSSNAKGNPIEPTAKIVGETKTKPGTPFHTPANDSSKPVRKEHHRGSDFLDHDTLSQFSAGPYYSFNHRPSVAFMKMIPLNPNDIIPDREIYDGFLDMGPLPKPKHVSLGFVVTRHIYPGQPTNHLSSYDMGFKPEITFSPRLGIRFGFDIPSHKSVPKDEPMVTRNNRALEIGRLFRSIEENPAPIPMPREKVSAFDGFEDGVKKAAENFAKEQAAPRKNIFQRVLGF